MIFLFGVSEEAANADSQGIEENVNESTDVECLPVDKASEGSPEAPIYLPKSTLTFRLGRE